MVLKVYSKIEDINELLLQSGLALEIIQFPTDADILISDDNTKFTIGERTFTKPVQVKEIISYIEAMVKDEQIALGSEAAVYLPIQRKIISEEQTITLTEIENKLLYTLATSKKGLSGQELLNIVWGYNEKVETNTLDSNIYRLRQKLESIGLGKLIICENNTFMIDKA